MKVATSIVLGKAASADLAAQAVTNAMQKADISIASSVLLLLTSEIASNTQEAIKAAAKAAAVCHVLASLFAHHWASFCTTTNKNRSKSASPIAVFPAMLH